MPPPAGGATFGMPAWTIQPAGTRFDPPIEVQMPNSTANPAGDNLPVVQWDHDLGQFVPMGRATVTEDGAYLITDAGSGVTKAGWGGLCVYDPDKCGKSAPPQCSDCEKVNSSADCPSCEAAAEKNGNECTQGNKCGQCSGGRCLFNPRRRTETCCGGDIYDGSAGCCAETRGTLGYLIYPGVCRSSNFRSIRKDVLSGLRIQTGRRADWKAERSTVVVSPDGFRILFFPSVSS